MVIHRGSRSTVIQPEQDWMVVPLNAAWRPNGRTTQW